MSTATLRVPGPSFLRPMTVRVPSGTADGGRPVSVGMGVPSTTEDGWWLGHLWVAKGDRVLDALEIVPQAGPPPIPPPAVLGPPFAGALAGLAAEEGGRQLIRLKLHPAPDAERPWERPLVVQVAIRWDPVRATTLRANELAQHVQRAFVTAIEAAGRPGR